MRVVGYSMLANLAGPIWNAPNQAWRKGSPHYWAHRRRKVKCVVDVGTLKHRHFSSEDVGILQMVADQIALAINAKQDEQLGPTSSDKGSNLVFVSLARPRRPRLARRPAR